MIKPTIGRVLWFWPNGRAASAQPESARVAYVHDDRLVNIAVDNHDGDARSERKVVLVQEGDVEPAGAFAEWMPYQVGQAKAEATAAAPAKGGAKAKAKPADPPPPEPATAPEAETPPDPSAAEVPSGHALE